LEHKKKKRVMIKNQKGRKQDKTEKGNKAKKEKYKTSKGAKEKVKRKGLPPNVWSRCPATGGGKGHKKL